MENKVVLLIFSWVIASVAFGYYIYYALMSGSSMTGEDIDEELKRIHEDMWSEGKDNGGEE